MKKNRESPQAPGRRLLRGEGPFTQAGERRTVTAKGNNISFQEIDTLVLSGGSLKGYSYVGVFKRLEEAGITGQIKYIAACSVGTIFALFFVLGMSHDEMVELVENVNVREFYNFDIKCFLSDYGFCDFSRIRNFLADILVKRDLSPQCTFQQLYQYRAIEYAVNATCINTQSTEYFHYLTHPDMEILTAIQMSTAVPFLFARVNYGNYYYVDGGILDNLPLNFFKGHHKSLAVMLAETPATYDKPIENIGQYLNLLITCVFNRYNSLREKFCFPGSSIIKISVGVSLMNLQLDQSEIKKLIDSGYNQTRYYLTLWSQNKRSTIEVVKSKPKIGLRYKRDNS